MTQFQNDESKMHFNIYCMKSLQISKG